MWRRLGGLCIGLLSLTVTTFAAGAEPVDQAKPKAEPSVFVRILREKEEPVALQTSIVRYGRPKVDVKDFHVDLVGAVHVGEKEYYKQLNKQFETYDVLLYELVAPEGTRVPKGAEGHGNHPLGAVQNGMKDMLGLEHQLTQIDYQKKNFVHADMSPEKFAKSMEDKKESVWTMMWRAAGYSMARQSARDPSGLGGMNLFGAMLSGDSVTMKREMAKQFEDIEGAMGMFDGPDGSTIITERNKVALEVLRREIAKGSKKRGVFYGAGHLPDMDKRLRDDFGLERKNVEWVTAWELRQPVRGKK